MSDACAGGAHIQIHSEARIKGRMNKGLQAVSDRGDANLVKLNGSKIQACLFKAQWSPFRVLLSGCSSTDNKPP